MKLGRRSRPGPGPFGLGAVSKGCITLWRSLSPSLKFSLSPVTLNKENFARNFPPPGARRSFRPPGRKDPDPCQAPTIFKGASTIFNGASTTFNAASRLDGRDAPGLRRLGGHCFSLLRTTFCSPGERIVSGMRPTSRRIFGRRRKCLPTRRFAPCPLMRRGASLTTFSVVAFAS